MALEQAIRQVVQGRKNVATQKLRVLATKAHGNDSTAAEELLREFQRTLTASEAILMSEWGRLRNH